MEKNENQKSKSTNDLVMDLILTPDEVQPQRNIS
jgi:hypothetical protein